MVRCEIGPIDTAGSRGLRDEDGGGAAIATQLLAGPLDARPRFGCRFRVPLGSAFRPILAAFLGRAGARRGRVLGDA
ncbi:hypothetical protein NDU88_003009 [Pleurodeles waltl]|uniref:Uncharacterized protein n=1 Tax=Pleurodeles waltl TaxID=8319 RepID=A0AAV7T3U7_PLEWA|nr:hypothetical protein NDU88_003009 [Pleurodeles waltl]